MNAIICDRCVHCYALLVMVTVPNPGKSAPRAAWGCKRCEPLVLVDEDADLYKRPSDWPEDPA